MPGRMGRRRHDGGGHRRHQSHRQPRAEPRARRGLYRKPQLCCGALRARFGCQAPLAARGHGGQQGARPQQGIYDRREVYALRRFVLRLRQERQAAAEPRARVFVEHRHVTHDPRSLRQESRRVLHPRQADRHPQAVQHRHCRRNGAAFRLARLQTLRQAESHPTGFRLHDSLFAALHMRPL